MLWRIYIDCTWCDVGFRPYSLFLLLDIDHWSTLSKMMLLDLLWPTAARCIRCFKIMTIKISSSLSQILSYIHLNMPRTSLLQAGLVHHCPHTQQVPGPSANAKHHERPHTEQSMAQSEVLFERDTCRYESLRYNRYEQSPSDNNVPGKMQHHLVRVPYL